MSTTVYRHIKQRLGHSLRGLYNKRHLVEAKKDELLCLGPDHSSGNGQHNSYVMYQQGGGRGVCDQALLLLSSGDFFHVAISDKECRGPGTSQVA